VIDEEDAKLTGHWSPSGAGKKFIGAGYQHDGKTGDGQCSARFEAKLPRAGRYEVRLACPPNSNRASNVPVEITHAGGRKTVTIDQRKPPIDGLFLSLGRYHFTADAPAVVTLKNTGTDGYVIIDAVQWLPAK